MSVYQGVFNKDNRRSVLVSALTGIGEETHFLVLADTEKDARFLRQLYSGFDGSDALIEVEKVVGPENMLIPEGLVKLIPAQTIELRKWRTT